MEIADTVLTPPRAKLGYGRVPGGNTPYLQQQNYGLAALAKRDALSNPFGVAPAPEPEPPAPEDLHETDEAIRVLEEGWAA